MKNRNKIIIILSIIFLVFAIAFLILGFALSGYNVIAWFGSKWAIWLYVFIGIYAFVVLFIIVSERIKNL